MAKTTKSGYRIFDGVKAVDLWGDDLTGWTVHSGEGAPTPDAEYFKLIPTLYRAVQLRSYSVSSMPFEILKGKSVYDSSADWQNKVSFMPNPIILLQLIDAAIVLTGRAYLFRDRSQVATKLLRYHIPTSVNLKDKSTPDNIIFTRYVDGAPKEFTDRDYIYFWLPDPFVEFGPAINYPAAAAANACGVLLNIDVFAAGFFQRGAIKAMLLSVKGMPLESDRLKLVDAVSKFWLGIRNAFRPSVINADAVTPVIIGEGMKELENVTLGEEKRQDISIAMGIPMSILFANAANYATSQQDELNFLTKTVIPECEFIASILNEQLFTPLGLHFNFLPETLDAMQEDEAARAQALGSLVTALADPISEVAMSILGYEIDDEDMAKLQELWNKKELAAKELAKQMAAKPPVDENDTREDAQDAPGSPQEALQDTQSEKTVFYMDDMQKWLRKALNALKRGKSAAVSFESMLIPANVYQNISSRLRGATDEPSVKAAFNVDNIVIATTAAEPYIDWETIREAVKALNYEPAPAPPPQPINIYNTQPAPAEVKITNVIPEQAAPQVTVKNTMPEQPAPVVNVNVPEQAPPDIKITNVMPDQPAPVVHVHQAERKDDEIIAELREAVKHDQED